MCTCDSVAGGGCVCVCVCVGSVCVCKITPLCCAQGAIINRQGAGMLGAYTVVQWVGLGFSPTDTHTAQPTAQSRQGLWWRLCAPCHTVLFIFLRVCWAGRAIRVGWHTDDTLPCMPTQSGCVCLWLCAYMSPIHTQRMHHTTATTLCVC